MEIILHKLGHHNQIWDIHDFLLHGDVNIKFQANPPLVQEAPEQEKREMKASASE